MAKLQLKYHVLEKRYLDILSEPPANAKSNASTMLLNYEQASHALFQKKNEIKYTISSNTIILLLSSMI